MTSMTMTMTYDQENWFAPNGVSYKSVYYIGGWDVGQGAEIELVTVGFCEFLNLFFGSGGQAGPGSNR